MSLSVEQAMGLMKSGVRWSMAEYSALDRDSRRALRSAQERIESERVESVADVLIARVEAMLADVAAESADLAAKGLLGALK